MLRLQVYSETKKTKLISSVAAAVAEGQALFILIMNNSRVHVLCLFFKTPKNNETVLAELAHTLHLYLREAILS